MPCKKKFKLGNTNFIVEGKKNAKFLTRNLPKSRRYSIWRDDDYVTTLRGGKKVRVRKSLPL